MKIVKGLIGGFGFLIAASILAVFGQAYSNYRHGFGTDVVSFFTHNATVPRVWVLAALIFLIGFSVGTRQKH